MHIELPGDHRYVSVDREMIVAVCEARVPSPAVARVTPLDGGRYNSTFRLEFAVEAPLVTDFSHKIITRDYVVQSWLPGTPASRVARSWDSDALARLWRDLGAILRRIHCQNSPHARHRRATRAMTEIERD